MREVLLLNVRRDKVALRLGDWIQLSGVLLKQLQFATNTRGTSQFLPAGSV